MIYARTVKLNPLTVIIAILIAAELAGILGALLAIPVASIIQVIARDVWDHRRGRLKDEPTVGEEEPAVTTGATRAGDGAAADAADDRGTGERRAHSPVSDLTARHGNTGRPGASPLR